MRAAICLLVLLAVSFVASASALGHGEWHHAAVRRHQHHKSDAAPSVTTPAAAPVAPVAPATPAAPTAPGSPDIYSLKVHEKLGRAALFEALNHPVSTIAERAHQSLNCSICEAWTAGILPTYETNSSKAIYMIVAEKACEDLQVMCKDATACATMCWGLINEFAPDVLDVVFKYYITPENICVALKQCDAPTPVPPPTDIPVKSHLGNLDGEYDWPSWSEQTGSGFFVHLSDVHLSLNYTMGSETQCGLPMCCESTDGPGRNGSQAGMWGDYNCDTPKILAKDVLDYIANMLPPPDFVLYTGDDPAHDVWKQSQELNLNAIRAWNGLINDTLLDANIPVFSTLGNHEGFPVNQFAGPGLDSWLYDGVADAIGEFGLPQDAQKTFRYGGYYQQRVRPGLRVISLNSNYFTSDNFWHSANKTDAYQQLNWLADVLSQTKRRAEKAIIMCHAPMNDWDSPIVAEYQKLSQKYATTIVNLFAGHTHLNNLQVLHAPSVNSTNGTITPGAPLHVLYVGGGIVPFGSLNPGFYVYSYNRDDVATKGSSYSHLVTDAVAHWGDLTAMNANKTSKGQWDIERFDLRQQLGAVDLSAAGIDATLPTLVSNATVFNAWVTAMYKGVFPYSPPAAQDTACYIDNDSAQEYHACQHQSGLNDKQIIHNKQPTMC